MAVSSNACGSLTLKSDQLNLTNRHVFVLSESGKPVFSRYGNEDNLATLFGLIQALVSVIQDGDDVLRCITVGETNIIFLIESPLMLVSVSRCGECVNQVQLQLRYFYNQIISILTSKQLRQIYEKRRNYDLRRLLSGSERLLENLTNLVEQDPSFLLGAVKCLPLSGSVRETISNAIIRCTSHLKSLVFAVLLANNQLVTLVRAKKIFMHPMDLHILLNLIDASESFKSAESWTPLCLPRFDSSGFVHAHVSYLCDDCEACLILLTVDRDSFFSLSEAKQKIVEKLRRYGCLEAINLSMNSNWPTMSCIDVPEILHYWYKYRSIAQYSSPQLEYPYLVSDQFQSCEYERLKYMYFQLHSRLHKQSRTVKLAYIIGESENWLGWITNAFELYVTFHPLIRKAAAINAVNKLLKWTKKEEDKIFIINSPTF